MEWEPLPCPDQLERFDEVAKDYPRNCRTIERSQRLSHLIHRSLFDSLSKLDEAMAIFSRRRRFAHHACLSSQVLNTTSC